MAKNTNTLTAQNLKNALWETLQAVKAKKIAPENANAVAATSREIMRVIRAEIAVGQMTGRKPSSNLIGFSDQ